MPTDPHRVTTSPRRARSTIPAPTRPTNGLHTPTRPYPSAGAATGRRRLSASFAAPVLIHPTSDPTVDHDRHPDAHSVLLIHGQPGSALIWTRVLPVLRAYGLRTFAVEQRADSHTGGEAVDQFANAAALGRLLDERQRPPAVIVGHSHGAGLALALAATAPRHVRALVLVAPVAGPQSISITDRVLATPILGSSLAWLGFHAASLALRVGPLRDQIRNQLVGSSATDAKQAARRISHSRTWRSFAAEQRRLVTYARCLHHGLNQLTCPILVVAGTDDPIAAPRVVTALAKRLPGAEILVTDTGHLIPIDDPDAIATAILRALRSDYRNGLSTRPVNGYLA
jgi:pimeloyl-ACP methyl ester carboxylesterase